MWEVSIGGRNILHLQSIAFYLGILRYWLAFHFIILGKRVKTKMYKSENNLKKRRKHENTQSAEAIIAGIKDQPDYTKPVGVWVTTVALSPPYKYGQRLNTEG